MGVDDQHLIDIKIVQVFLSQLDFFSQRNYHLLAIRVYKNREDLRQKNDCWLTEV